jgi:D-proline reductase (dithiol) PrdB
MARLNEIPEPTRIAVNTLACAAFESTPFVLGPALAQRRVAMVSSAALILRGDTPFAIGSGEYRPLPAGLIAQDILLSHVSINFDRAGFQRDLNVVYPIDRLRELAAEGVIGSVAQTHFSIMGSTDPISMVESADRMAEGLLADKVDAVLLLPV